MNPSCPCRLAATLCRSWRRERSASLTHPMGGDGEHGAGRVAVDPGGGACRVPCRRYRCHYRADPAGSGPLDPPTVSPQERRILLRAAVQQRPRRRPGTVPASGRQRAGCGIATTPDHSLVAASLTLRDDPAPPRRPEPNAAPTWAVGGAGGYARVAMRPQTGLAADDATRGAACCNRPLVANSMQL